jgi:hypothetical protein
MNGEEIIEPKKVGISGGMILDGIWVIVDIIMEFFDGNNINGNCFLIEDGFYFFVLISILINGIYS